MPQRRASWWIGLTLLLLTGCGFHLRGQVALPDTCQPVAINDNSHDTLLAQRLRSQLHAQGIRITANPQQARLILELSDSRFERSQANLSSNTQWRQYTLRYQVTLQVKNHQQQMLSPRSVISSVRYTAENPNQLLGSRHETRTLQQEMRQELAVKVLDHFNTPALQQRLRKETR